MIKPNIVFLTTDHQRFDSLDAVQCGKEVTPRLNALARESARFDNAYTACPLCVPARTAMATGRYPHHTGVVLNDWEGKNAITEPVLHDLLCANGYSMGHFGRNHLSITPPLSGRLDWEAWIDENLYWEFGLQKGVDRFDARTDCKLTISERIGDAYLDKKYSSGNTFFFEGEESDMEDAYYIRNALNFLDERKAKNSPFAMFVNLWAPHPPFGVPKRLSDAFPPDQIELPSNCLLVPENEPTNRRKGAAAQLGDSFDEDILRKAWSAHLALTHFADELIGSLIDRLKENGLWENTLFVFTSDHGDFMGQRRMFQKMELYDSAAHIPLLIRSPKSENVATIESLTSQVDLFPTLCDMLELDGASDLTLDGVSHWKEGGWSDPVEGRSILCQYHGNSDLGDTRLGLIQWPLKYVYDPDSEAELYHLVDDPLELENLAKSAVWEKEVQRLHQTLLEQYGLCPA